LTNLVRVRFGAGAGVRVGVGVRARVRGRGRVRVPKRQGGLDGPERLEVALLVAHVALVARQLRRRACPGRG